MDQLSAHLDRGWDLIARGDFVGALTSARKSLEIDDGSPDAHNLMGFVCAAEGNAELALDHYRQAIELDETFFEAMLHAAEILIHPLGELDEAIKLMDDALDFVDTPDEIAEAFLLKIECLMVQGKMEEAAALATRLPDGPFEHPHVDLAIGRVRFELGDVDSAAPFIERALEGDPTHADAHYYRGLLYEARKDPHGATLEFLECRAIDAAMPPVAWSKPTDIFEKEVQAAIRTLPAELAQWLEGTLVVVTEIPGVEVVTDGVDPRVPLLLDAIDPSARRVGRLFVYQWNVERMVGSASLIERELTRVLEVELTAMRQIPPAETS